MADDNSASDPLPKANALVDLVPKMDLVGPTVDDDIQRAIWRYGAEEVKRAVKQATKAKRGRKREPDWSELREVIEADARDWLSGLDPFEARSNYAIAKGFAERSPGHSAISTHQRIERKLAKRPYDRRWFTLVSAEHQGRDGHPFEAYLRTLQALAELPDHPGSDAWRVALQRAQSTVADYEAREGSPPPKNLTLPEVEEAVRKSSQNALAFPLRTPGLFGSKK